MSDNVILDNAKTILPAQASGNGNNEVDVPTVANIFAESGIAGLTENSEPEKIIDAINKLIVLTAKKDPVWLGVAQSELIKKLKDLKVQGPSDFVKKLFRPNKPRTNNNAGREILFEDPELWPDEVDGSDLLHELKEVFDRFLILPERAETALCLWVAFAWTHDAFSISPILDFRSPTKRCGKSTALRVVHRLVPRPLLTSNISTAALFRSIEYFKPTLLVDEVDTFLKFNDEIQGVLNAGHERDGAYVLRVEGDDNQPKKYCVWSPKVLAGIGKRKDTLEDRSICVPMKRKGPEESVEKFRVNQVEILAVLRRKMARWAEDNIETLKLSTPEMPNGLNDRAEDNWEPLIAAADLCGGEWPELAREAAVKLSGGDNPDEDAIGIRLLSDIRDFFQEYELYSVPSEQLEKHLQDLDDSPWPEFKQGRPITKTGIGRLLKSFGMKSKSIRFTSGNVARGYSLDQFEDTFTRYLPDTPSQSVTSVTSLENKELSSNSKCYKQGDVTLSNSDNSLIKQRCNNVTLQTGVSEQENIIEEEI
jgi:putative DNA primase/helicase